MRKDLHNYTWHPNIGHPTFYQDIAMMGYSLYLSSWLKGKNFIFTPATMDNLSSQTRSSYFKNNATSIGSLYSYFAQNGSNQYQSLANKYLWKEIEFKNPHRDFETITDQMQLDFLKERFEHNVSQAILIYGCSLGKLVNLIDHWAYITPHADTYKDVTKIVKPKQEDQNPFVEGVLASKKNHPHLTLAWAHLALTPMGLEPLGTSGSSLSDSVSWVRRLITVSKFQDYKQYEFNTIPTADWLKY